MTATAPGHKGRGRRWRTSPSGRPGRRSRCARAPACSTRRSLRAGRPCPVRGGRDVAAAAACASTSGEVERRSNAGMTTGGDPRGLGGRLPDLRRRRPHRGRGAGSARRRRWRAARPRHRRAGVAADRLRLPAEPGGAGSSSSTSSRRRWTTRPATSTACAARCSRQHDIPEVRAELAAAQAARPGPARTPTGRSPWRSRCATGCTVRTSPPRLLRVYPTAVRAGELWAWPSTWAPPRWSPTWSTSPPGGSPTPASAYNAQIACGDDVISRIVYSKRKHGLERLQKLAVEYDQRPARGDAAAQRHRAARASTSSPSPATPPWPTCSSGWTRVRARGAVHPGTHGAPQAHRRRARA